MKRRDEQLTSSMQRAIQEVLGRGLHDPRISGLITVTSLRLNPETREAFVSISVLPQDKQHLTLHGLRAAAKHIRREVGDLIRTRNMPTLVFLLDESLKKQAAVIEAIARAASEFGPTPPGQDQQPESNTTTQAASDAGPTGNDQETAR